MYHKQYYNTALSHTEYDTHPVPCLSSSSTRNCRWAAELARGREWTQKCWRKLKWIL